jgi:glycosyltransferase involved in cell wall biosynthesis
VCSADGAAVVVDLQAIQSVDQRHRGIPRYVTDLTGAVESLDPGIVGAYTLNPDLALPEVGLARRLVEAGKLRRSDDIDWAGVGLYHLASPMEMSVPVDRLLPPAARAAGVPWAVTFYDLIPHLMPDYYLEDPGLRRRYRARLQLVRTATAVLTLSEASRVDVAEHLGIDPARVVVVGAGTSARFVPPASRAEAAAAAVRAVPGLRAPYVFYIGSYEKRKNLEPLLEAWSRLPEAVRGRWQLALCCPLRPLERNHLLWRAGQLGITDSVCLTGFVDDDVLLTLHQGSDLFVFPSLYEGYGLPVAEALACGAPVLAADASSLPEIVEPEALFEPSAPEPMAATIERGLTDEAFRARLLAASGRAPSSWDDVARATLEVYRRVLSGDLTPPPAGSGVHFRRTGVAEERRSGAAGPEAPLRVAFAAALPPDDGPAAAWNAEILAILAERPELEVHAFADRPPGSDVEVAAFTERRTRRRLEPVGGVAVRPLAALEAVEGLEGRFDAVVYALADDAGHTGCLAALRRRGDGVVVARDVTLAELYGQTARSGGLPDGLAGTIRSAYGDAVQPGTGAHDTLPTGEARRLGLLFSRDVLRHCRRLLVRTPSDATLAGLDAGPGDRAKVALAGDDPAAVADAIYEEIFTRRSPL